MNLKTSLLSIALLITACGASPGTPDSGTTPTNDAGATTDAGVVASGTLTGETAFAVKTLKVSPFTATSDGGLDRSVVTIGLASQNVNLCSSSATPSQPTEVLFVGVSQPFSSGAVLAGTYTFGSPSTGMNVMFVRGTALPDGSTNYIAQTATGTLTLDEVGTAFVRGSFSAQLQQNDGGTSGLTGSFVAPTCN